MTATLRISSSRACSLVVRARNDVNSKTPSSVLRESSGQTVICRGGADPKPEEMWQ